MSFNIILVCRNRNRQKKLRAFFGRQPDMAVVEETSFGIAAVRLARQLQPEIVIVDMMLPDMTSVEVAQIIISRVLSVKVVVILTQMDTQLIAKIVISNNSDDTIVVGDLDELVDAMRNIIKTEPAGVLV